MGTFEPTAEQQACYDAMTETTDNLMINALAGAAKTTTLVGMAHLAPTKSILTLAFNKKIATEMQERLPKNCEAKTLNSIGFKIWWEKLGRIRTTLDTSKTYNIMSKLIGEIEDDEIKSAAFDGLADLIRAVDFGKSCGWVPDAFPKTSTRLMDDAEFFAHMEERPMDWEQDLIIEASLRSLNLAFEGTMDFADQLLMPTVFFATFPTYDIVMVDEAQDLSALNHQMLQKLCKRSRLIAVGDPNQAIYGFRGAHEDSMSLMQETFKMRELYLSISFRCPQAVVKESHWRAPHMKWAAWAKEGTVQRMVEWSVEDLADGDVIICRNNAPLFSMAITLLREGRYPELIGNDIGKALLKIMKKFGPMKMSQADAFQKLEEWKEEKLAKTRNKSNVHDRAACMSVFLEQSETLGGAIAYAEHIFASTGTIKLMTGHKSKGLEFDRVFFLDEFLLNKESDQDRNLRYVIITRAKDTLTYVKSENFLRVEASA